MGRRKRVGGIATSNANDFGRWLDRNGVGRTDVELRYFKEVNYGTEDFVSIRHCFTEHLVPFTFSFPSHGSDKLLHYTALPF